MATMEFDQGIKRPEPVTTPKELALAGLAKYGEVCASLEQQAARTAVVARNHIQEALSGAVTTTQDIVRFTQENLSDSLKTRKLGNSSDRTSKLKSLGRTSALAAGAAGFGYAAINGVLNVIK